MEFFVTLVDGWKPLTIVAKSFILDVAGFVDTPLSCDIKVSTKKEISHSNRKNDNFIDFLLVKLLSYNLGQKKTNKFLCSI